MALKERITQIDEIWSVRAELENTKEELMNSQNLLMWWYLFSLWPRENCFHVRVEMLVVTRFLCSCRTVCLKGWIYCCKPYYWGWYLFSWILSWRGLECAVHIEYSRQPFFLCSIAGVFLCWKDSEIGR